MGSLAFSFPSNFWTHKPNSSQSIVLGRVGLSPEDAKKLSALAQAGKAGLSPEDAKKLSMIRGRTPVETLKANHLSIKQLLQRHAPQEHTWEMIIGIGTVVYEGDGCEAVLYQPTVNAHYTSKTIGTSTIEEENTDAISNYLVALPELWEELGFWSIGTLNAKKDTRKTGNKILQDVDVNTYLTGQDLLTEYVALILRADPNLCSWGGQLTRQWTLDNLESLTSHPLKKQLDKQIEWLHSQKQVLRGALDETSTFQAERLLTEKVSLHEAAVWGQKFLEILDAGAEDPKQAPKKAKTDASK